MTEERASKIIEKIIKVVFSVENHDTLDKIYEKFAFDIYLPRQVKDSITGEATWTYSRCAELYMTTENTELKDEATSWMQEKRDLNSLDDILDAWKKVNYMTTERVQNSINVLKSDTIYECENVYHSTNCSKCKSIIFCDGCGSCEYMLASQRSGNSSFSIRVDDSVNCSNCYNVIFSNKVSNSYFIQDCFNITNCMFCSHIVGKEYCIANMQYTKEEYLFYKKEIIKWIINS